MNLIACNEFFRAMVKTNHGRRNDAHFASLNNLTTSAGGYMYKSLLFTGLTASLVALVIGGFTLAVASRSKGYDEVKKRVVRVVIIMWLLTSLTAIAGLLANIFTWW